MTLPPPGSPGRILVIRGGAIGDFILTLPVLAALRKELPRARVEVLGYRQIAQLARCGDLAAEIRSIEARPLAGFFARHGELAPDLREYFAGFSVVLSYLFDPDQIFEANVALCSRAQFIAGPHRPMDAAGIHATDVFLEPLRKLAIFDADPVPRLAVEGAMAREGAIALHPGSGSERKNWPEPKWAELLTRIVATTSRTVLLVGGEAEVNRLERLAAVVPAHRLAKAFQLPLPELARRLASCDAFVGHDSGITHLAAAAGVPVLALWGESVEAVWRPRGEQVRILRHPAGLAALEVTRVLDELPQLCAGHAASPGPLPSDVIEGG